MAISVNHNMMAAYTARNLNTHYGRLTTSTQRLSSGLRINSAADDAAGLAIRELQRADIAALHQGARNANDAISMIQVADGALGIIDEKLIRMKELAEQAATGTYDSTQRLMIDSEFQAMASEIDRIVNATDFNGHKLLDGSLSGAHDGSNLTATGKMKIHFGTANDAAEDYYYVEIGDCSTFGLGLRKKEIAITPTSTNTPQSMLNLAGATLGGYSKHQIQSGIVPMAVIPKGSKNVVLIVDGIVGAEDDIQLFTRDGVHLAGTKIDLDPKVNDYSWEHNGIKKPEDLAIIMTEANGFNPDASYRIISNGTGNAISGEFNDGGITSKLPPEWGLDHVHNTTVTNSSGKMTISYSGDYDRVDYKPNDGNINDSNKTKEKIVIDEAIEDILIIVSGVGIFNIEATWDSMPPNVLPDNPTELGREVPGDLISIKIQQEAQEALVSIDEAIVRKDKIRANLGALQNRLENTISNLNIQAENLQAAESRISDVDVATEMTNFVSNQILTQSATAMLSQANSMPQMMMQLING